MLRRELWPVLNFLVRWRTVRQSRNHTIQSAPMQTKMRENLFFFFRHFRLHFARLYGMLLYGSNVFSIGRAENADFADVIFCLLDRRNHRRLSCPIEAIGHRKRTQSRASGIANRAHGSRCQRAAEGPRGHSGRAASRIERLPKWQGEMEGMPKWQSLAGQAAKMTGRGCQNGRWPGRPPASPWRDPAAGSVASYAGP